jgi:hypothetical protein
LLLGRRRSRGLAKAVCRRTCQENQALQPAQAERGDPSPPPRINWGGHALADLPGVRITLVAFCLPADVGDVEVAVPAAAATTGMTIGFGIAASCA